MKLDVIINGVRYIPKPATCYWDFSNFHEACREARADRGETLDEVSADTGLSKSTLHGIERGETDPRLSTIQKLADYYGIEFP